MKTIFLNQQNFLQFKEIFSLTECQRNVSLIQRNFFLGEGKRRVCKSIVDFQFLTKFEPLTTTKVVVTLII